MPQCWTYKLFLHDASVFVMARFNYLCYLHSVLTQVEIGSFALDGIVKMTRLAVLVSTTALYGLPFYCHCLNSNPITISNNMCQEMSIILTH